jgi:hypothetical protein
VLFEDPRDSCVELVCPAKDLGFFFRTDVPGGRGRNKLGPGHLDDRSFGERHELLPHSAMAALAVDPTWGGCAWRFFRTRVPAELIADTAASVVRDVLSIRELHSSGADWIARAAEELPISSIAFLHSALLAFRADHRGDVIAFGGPDLEDSVSNQFEEEC